MVKWVSVVTGPGALVAGGSGAAVTLFVAMAGLSLFLTAFGEIDHIILWLSPFVVSLLLLSAWQAGLAVLLVLAVSVGPMLLVAYLIYAQGNKTRSWRDFWRPAA